MVHKTPIYMLLVPISKKNVRNIFSKQVTPEQWLSYWGNNKIERLQRVLESVLIAYGGAWLSWFISFMAGGVVSAFVGTGLIFNWMFSPWINAYTNNNKIIFLNDKPLNHAVYKGKIISLSKIRRRSGKSIGALSQDYLDMTLSDEEGVELEILTPWQSDYRKLRVGMTVAQIIASKYKDFSVISVISDAYVPSCEVWMGDYPYLQKVRFKKLLSTIEKSLKCKEESKNIDGQNTVKYLVSGVQSNEYDIRSSFVEYE